MSQFTRRCFLQSSAAILAGGVFTQSAIGPKARAQGTSASEKIVVGVMGVNGRGTALARGFAGQTTSEVAYVCDVDERAASRAKAAIASRQKRAPQTVSDFRKILDDKSVDALVVAAPDHWHGPASILACTAGKHVYVEKPCCHNPAEGEMMVQAARKHKRVVTMGTQRRSWPLMREVMPKLKDLVGEIHFVRSWYNNRRGSIGTGKQVAVPDWLDFAAWQGPAPREKYRDNILHYNWHWFWNWGTGELGNNGIHALDLCRWGAGVDLPKRVTSTGGRYRFKDDQQTPDTHVVTFEFDNLTMTWEGLSWAPLGVHDTAFGMSFHGTKGTLITTGSEYRLYDMYRKLVTKKTGAGGDAVHLENFLTSIREDKRPHADIDEAHKSTLLCHLGNIAHRVGGPLKTDPATGRIQDFPQAEKLWQREYAPGWQPKV